METSHSAPREVSPPLHTVARFSKALPEGSLQGAGIVHIPNRELGQWSNNLHAYWDDLLGTDEDPASIERLAEELIMEHPQGGFVNELAKTNIRDWAEESVEISLKTVYNNLDPEITKFVDVPVGYDAGMHRRPLGRGLLWLGTWGWLTS